MVYKLSSTNSTSLYYKKVRLKQTESTFKYINVLVILSVTRLLYRLSSTIALWYMFTTWYKLTRIMDT